MEKSYKGLREVVTFIIEKVLRTRTRGGKKEYFVRWAGYPSSHDSWVDIV